MTEPYTDLFTPLEARVADALDVDGMADAAQRMVRIPSWGGEETPAQELMVTLMAGIGLEVDAWEIPLDEVAAHPAYASEIERTRALGVVGTLPGSGGGRSLILDGHVDVVPPGDAALWTHPPFGGVVEGGRLYGRGSVDMKGQLVAGLFALDALRRAGVVLTGDVHLFSVVGEEDGGMGTLASILRGYRADGAVVMEPTELIVAPAQAGCLNFRVRVPGRAAHGAVREEGVSALEKLFPVYHALEELERERNRRLGGDPLFARYRTPFAICVGTVHGGDWASSVPDHVAVEGRYGVAPGEEPEAARKEMAATLAAAAAADPFLRDHPPVLEWWGGRFLAARTEPTHPLVESLRGAAAAVLGRDVPLEGMTYGADMGLLANVAQVRTVLFGAGDVRRAHRPDEYVDVADLTAQARALSVAAMRFCGVAE
ncbi:MAG TPA: ArgE/DapE family deacylase [Longimicrobiales bacterium]|nr:ArgE/DapE family deacylase [Longimicrobiales bacterium]